MKRCAIYTRKSTEEGLEQDFNSLDAQREACEAYIKSQKHEGWKLVRKRFDDGGFSGGSMERPALQDLLDAIERGEVDIVVVYKVDRLTRSLADFAKMVDRFDRRDVSFVSVTQQFNTTTSMGRLTLNVLLSFAQFEREVTAERIRDKIAASKKKGMWMGGPPPLGYDAVDKKLMINPTEAETVRTLFKVYRELGTVRDLLREANTRGIVTKRRTMKNGSMTGGKPFSRGNLYQLLKNPTYVGRIPHKDKTYPGQHQAIVDSDLWQAVQDQLSNNAVPRRSASNAMAPSLLTGLLYDETGDLLCPTYANKNGKRYRYYISKRLMHDADRQDGWRLPALEIEVAAVGMIVKLLRDGQRLMGTLADAKGQHAELAGALDRAETLAEGLNDGQANKKQVLVRDLIDRIDVGSVEIAVTLRRRSLMSGLGIDTTISDDDSGRITLTEPIQLQRRGVESKLVIPGQQNREQRIDQPLCRLVGKARLWFEALARSNARTVRDLALDEGVPEYEITRVLPLAFLAPDIVATVLDGRQPAGLTATSLRRMGRIQSDWAGQRRVLGF